MRLAEKLDWKGLMYVGLHAKGHLFLSDWNQTYIFCRGVSKTFPLYNFKKACHVGARLNHVDSQTGMRKLTSFATLQMCLKL